MQQQSTFPLFMGFHLTEFWYVDSSYWKVVVVKQLSEKLDIPEERVLIRGLRIVQLIESGYAELVYTNTDINVRDYGAY
jgi:hypothetical protein